MRAGQGSRALGLGFDLFCLENLCASVSRDFSTVELSEFFFNVVNLTARKLFGTEDPMAKKPLEA